MLSVRNVSAGYSSKSVLHAVSLEVARGQFVGLIGPNGCGKTTLLRVASGILRPTSGEVLVAGESIRRIARRTLAKTMACLHQDLSLDLPFTVREVATMGRWPHLSRLGWERGEDHQAVEHAMALADVSHLGDRPITEISGGERQRAFIAMCLAQQPQVLLLDEPTAHLDIAHQLSLLDLIRGLNREAGMTVLAVFHDLNLASEYCERLVMLAHGAVDAEGAPDAVLTAERIAKVYGASVLVERNPVSLRPRIAVAAGMNYRPNGLAGDTPHPGQAERER